MAHDVYRSIMCGLFTLFGLYTWLIVNENKNCIDCILEYNYFFDTVSKLAQLYMVIDIVMIFVGQYYGIKFRVDLFLHHVMAIIIIKMCTYYNLQFVWGLIGISELLSIWTGLASYGRYANHYKLRKECYKFRVLTIVAWRLPWWISLSQYYYLVHTIVMLVVLVLAGIIILFLDTYWLIQCIKRIHDMENKLYHNKNN